MRLATWQQADAVKSGVVTDEGAYAFPAGMTVLDAVGLGLPSALDLGRRTVASEPAVTLEKVRLLPPLSPPSVRDFAAFEQHVRGALRSVTASAVVPEEWYTAPAFYFSNPHGLVGAHDDVPIPPGCVRFDFELEVAAVLTGEGRSLSVGEADEHIFGYAILNDWSARDVQSREMRVGLGPAKSKDTATTLGPWIVTRDELDPLMDEDGFLPLRMAVTVNDVEVGGDVLSNMAWTFPELIAHASRGAVIRSGDVIGSGTCGNGGSLAELWGTRGETAHRPLDIGDIVTMTVSGLGEIRNRVVAGFDPPPVRSARRRGMSTVAEAAQ
jgi:2-keto-4-pentenoate hydratase/2-oxohepta-3-ene-1,7-dioic acid hydratase in catechol pathway